MLWVETHELHQLLHPLATALFVPDAWMANGSPITEPTRRRELSDPDGS